MVELIGGGFIINWTTPSSFSSSTFLRRSSFSIDMIVREDLNCLPNMYRGSPKMDKMKHIFGWFKNIAKQVTRLCYCPGK